VRLWGGLARPGVFDSLPLSRVCNPPHGSVSTSPNPGVQNGCTPMRISDRIFRVVAGGRSRRVTGLRRSAARTAA
jgi:hypothetical protein